MMKTKELHFSLLVIWQYSLNHTEKKLLSSNKNERATFIHFYLLIAILAASFVLAQQSGCPVGKEALESTVGLFKGEFKMKAYNNDLKSDTQTCNPALGWAALLDSTHHPSTIFPRCPYLWLLVKAGSINASPG